MPNHYLNDLGAFLAFGAGWATKGLLYAIVGETVFKPLAKQIGRKVKKWEHTSPRLTHFASNHKGLRPSVCEIDRCQRVK